MIATITVLADISTAPAAGVRYNAKWIKDSCGKRYGKGVVAGRPREVLCHLSICAASQLDNGDGVKGRIPDEYDIAGLYCDVGARSDGNAHVGLCQGGGVVGPIADHGNDEAL